MLGKQISVMFQSCYREIIYINLLSLCRNILQPIICINKGRVLCLEQGFEIVPATIKDKQEFIGDERQCNSSLEVNPPDMFTSQLYVVNSNTGGHCLGYTAPMSCLQQFFCFYLTLTQKCEWKGSTNIS